jgi:hypothetical protein
MPKGSSISLSKLIGVLCASLTGAPALDETKYPEWKGQWVRANGAEGASWDAREPEARKDWARKDWARKDWARKNWGLGQQSPLTPEYQALFGANLEQLVAGVKASDPTTRCIPPIPSAMPRVMMAMHGDRHHA